MGLLGTPEQHFNYPLARLQRASYFLCFSCHRKVKQFSALQISRPSQHIVAFGRT